MNTVARTVAVAIVALACWASGAGMATAHTALTGSDPASGATAGTAPRVVTLTFSEAINPTFANIVVNSTDGRNWVTGTPAVVGPEIRASMAADMPGGEYKVGYRVVSEDGHPVTGSFSFTVAGKPRSAEPAPLTSGASPTTTAAPPTSSAPLGTDSRTSIIFAAVAGLALGGAITFWQSRKHRRRNTRDDEFPPDDADA